MADNLQTGNTGTAVVTALGSWSGDSAHAFGSFSVIASGAEGSWTFSTVVGGAGAVSAGVQRMTLASDDPAVATLGGVADAAATQGSTGSISAKLRTVTSQLNTIASTGIPITGTVTVGSHAVTNAGTFVVQVDGTALTRLTDIETNTDSLAVVGNGAAATAQRVTLANDSTGIVALTTSTASIGKLAANSGVDIGDVDVLSVVPGTGATNLGKASNAAYASGETGVLLMGVRNDGTGTEFADVNGDYCPIAVDNTGTVQIAGTVVVSSGTVSVSSVLAGTSGSSLGKAEDAVHSSGDTGVFVLAVRRDSAASTATTDGDYTALTTDSTGRLWCNVSNTVTVASHAVTNAGTFVVQVDGTALTRLTDIETNTDSGAVVGNGAAATSQRVTLANDSTGVIATVSTLTTLANGQTAHDSAISGSPLRVGATAETSLSTVTLVADGDATNLYAGVDGVLITRPHCNLEGIASGNASNTDGTSTEVIATAGAGIKLYLTSVILTNTSSSNIYVELKSGTTVKATIPVPANGGAIFNPPVPLPPNAANEAWNFDPSAATTTLYCTAIAFKSKV